MFRRFNSGKNHKSAVILSVAIVILITVIAGYILYKATVNNQAGSADRSDTTSPIPTITGSTTTDASTGISTYTSGADPQRFYANFSIQYSSDWELSETSSNKGNAIALTSGNYVLTIQRFRNSASTPCYKQKENTGDAVVNLDVGKFTSVQTTAGEFDYFKTAVTGSKLTYLFCGPSAFPKSILNTVSKIGFIIFNTPANPDTSRMKAMEAVIMTIASP